MIEFSGPNFPPVINSGPTRVLSIKVGNSVAPETIVPQKIKLKFQPICRAIGTHRRCVKVKNIPVNNPSSNAIASPLKRLKFAFVK